MLWDLLPDAPRLGGAPCNVLVHLRRLGHPVAYVTAIGPDDLGARAMRELGALGVEVTFVAIAAALPTGRADVVLDAGVPRFSIAPGAAYESVDLTAAEVTRIAESAPGAVVYGTLAQRSATLRRSTMDLVAALPAALRFYDVNLRTRLWDRDLVTDLARLASFVKVNAEEAAVVAPFFDIPWPGTEAFCRALGARLGLRGVAVTAGVSGAAVLLDGEYRESRAPTVAIADTIGSGDAFSAAVVDGILAGRSVEAILRRSIALGALVSTHPGATPAWDPAELASLEAVVAQS